MYGGPAELSTTAVLKRDVPWETYLTARLISDRDLQLIRRYDKHSRSVQRDLLQEVWLIADAQRYVRGS